MPVVIATAALLGLAVGSFLNVVVHRVPAGLSLVRPGSHCPRCERAVRARHNVPVLGWLILGGRCADCAARISARYPLLELATAVLFAATVARMSAAGRLAATPAYLTFGALCLVLALIDLDVARLPNAIVYPGAAAMAVLLSCAALVEGDPDALLRAVGGCAAALTLFGLLAYAAPGGLGFGDVKFAGIIGAALAYLSWAALLVGVFAAFVLGGLAAGVLIYAHRIARRALVPFGPALVAGAMVALFAADPLFHAYTHLVTRA